jgi:hypothetical protein
MRRIRLILVGEGRVRLHVMPAGSIDHPVPAPYPDDMLTVSMLTAISRRDGASRVPCMCNRRFMRRIYKPSPFDGDHAGERDATKWAI